MRLLSVATLLMIALCIVVSASIALAEEPAPATEDVYEFDFVIEAETLPHPEFVEPGNTQDI